MNKLIFALLAAVLFPAAVVAQRPPKLLIMGASMTACGGSYARRLAQVYPTRIVAKSGHATRWIWQQIKHKNLRGFTHLIVLEGVNDVNNGAKDTEQNLLAIYRKARRAGLITIGITVPPWKGYKSWSALKGWNTLRLNDWIRSQEERTVDKVVDFANLIRHMDDELRLAPRYDQNTDHLHTNKWAHILLMREVQKAL